MNKLKINIHPSFILLLAIGLYGGFLKEVVSFSLIIILHEIGHFIAAKIFNVNHYSIHLTIIGCMIDLDDYSNLNLSKQIIINCAGILINLILIVCFSIMNRDLLVRYNKLMIFINLIPIYPLDGYKIIYSLLSNFFENEYIVDCLFYLSLILIVILLFIIFVLKLYGYLLIIIFLLYKTFENKINSQKIKRYEYLKIKRMLFS